MLSSSREVNNGSTLHEVIYLSCGSHPSYQVTGDASLGTDPWGRVPGDTSEGIITPGIGMSLATLDGLNLFIFIGIYHIFY